VNLKLNDDIMRLPINLHVQDKPLQFIPPVIDFGIVQTNFDPCKIVLKGVNRGKKLLQISDV